MTDKECCGVCKYHKKEDGEWTCTNEDSEAYGLETHYQDTCEEYESR